MKIKVKVIPRSSKNQIIGYEEDTLRIKLTAPAIEGKANEALVSFLSEVYDRPKKNIRIVSGKKSRNKIIEIEGIFEGGK